MSPWLTNESGRTWGYDPASGRYYQGDDDACVPPCCGDPVPTGPCCGFTALPANHCQSLLDAYGPATGTQYGNRSTWRAGLTVSVSGSGSCELGFLYRSYSAGGSLSIVTDFVLDAATGCATSAASQINAALSGSGEPTPNSGAPPNVNGGFSGPSDVFQIRQQAEPLQQESLVFSQATVGFETVRVRLDGPSGAPGLAGQVCDSQEASETDEFVLDEGVIFVGTGVSLTRPAPGSNRIEIGCAYSNFSSAEVEGRFERSTSRTITVTPRSYVSVRTDTETLAATVEQRSQTVPLVGQTSMTTRYEVTCTVENPDVQCEPPGAVAAMLGAPGFRNAFA
ncbi:MAG: hypothetical protein AAGF47_03810 [Planctomycetota bacterium]